MTIQVKFQEQTQQYSVTNDGEEIANVYRAYLDSADHKITESDLAEAFDGVYNAPQYTEFDIVKNPARRLQEVYSRLGLFHTASEPEQQVNHEQPYLQLAV